MKNLRNFIFESKTKENYVLLAQWGGNNGSTGIAFINEQNGPLDKNFVKDLCDVLDIEFRTEGFDELDNPVGCYCFSENEFEWIEQHNIKYL